MLHDVIQSINGYSKGRTTIRNWLKDGNNNKDLKIDLLK